MRKLSAFIALVALASGGAQAGEGPKPTQAGDVIGAATMDEARRIVLDLRSVECDGSLAEGRVSYAPGDPNYAAVLAHIGALRPGETKPVRAWPSEPCPGR